VNVREAGSHFVQLQQATPPSLQIGTIHLELMLVRGGGDSRFLPISVPLVESRFDGWTPAGEPPPPDLSISIRFDGYGGSPSKASSPSTHAAGSLGILGLEEGKCV
jgi:hypothetical protein